MSEPLDKAPKPQAPSVGFDVSKMPAPRRGRKPGSKSSKAKAKPKLASQGIMFVDNADKVTAARFRSVLSAQAIRKRKLAG
jgi:hypothetical protein